MNKQGGDMLSFQHISKSFPGVKALQDVSFSIRKGEVHALVGENGAGKSTLLNILKGIYQPDEGTIVYDGSDVKIKGPGHASSIGINMVHQEINLVPELTVGQNILLGNEPMTKGIAINYSKLYSRCREVIEELECPFSDKEQVKKLSAAQMQMIAIARSLMYNSKVVAFDEPTASLSNAETKHLFKIIDKLKSNGTSIIYVSHRLEEIFEIADRVTILRDGKVIDTLDVKDVDKKTLVRLMVGREVSEYMQHTANYSTDEVALKVENLTTDGVFENVSFDLKRGEILGISGLVGSKRTDVVRAIFGADKYTSGKIYMNGKPLNIKSPSRAIKAGIALLPEERKSQGFIKLMSNDMNVNISSLDKSMKHRMLNYRSLKSNTEYYIKELKITPPNPDMETTNMSGGNQQKVVLAKWLSINSQIIIFDEPTRGLDVGAKSEIYRLMDEFVRNGNSIIMVSSELPEILGMSDRILVMHEGKAMATLDGATASEVEVLHYAMGGN